METEWQRVSCRLSRSVCCLREAAAARYLSETVPAPDITSNMIIASYEAQAMDANRREYTSELIALCDTPSAVPGVLARETVVHGAAPPVRAGGDAPNQTAGNEEMDPVTRKILLPAVLLFVLVTQAHAALSPDTPIAQRVRALELTDAPSDVANQLVQEVDTDAVVAAVVSRLEDTGPGAPHEAARDRLWKLLADLHPDDRATGRITHPLRIQQLELAVVGGSVSTRIAVIQRLPLVAPSARNGLAEQVNGQLLTESDPLLVASILDALAVTRTADQQSVAYAQDLALGNFEQYPHLWDALQHQYNARKRMHGIRVGAAAAVLSAKPDLAAATAYAEAFEDDSDVMVQAMRLVGQERVLFASAPLNARLDWLDEFVRRYCLPQAADLRSNRGFDYLYNVAESHADMRPGVCAHLPGIATACPEDGMTEGVAMMLEYFCDE